jgi:hypothetical protein
MQFGKGLALLPAPSTARAVRVSCWQGASAGSVRGQTWYAKRRGQWPRKGHYRIRREGEAIEKLRKDPTIFEQLFPAPKDALRRADARTRRSPLGTELTALHQDEDWNKFSGRTGNDEDDEDGSILAVREALRNVSKGPFIVYLPRASPSLLESDFFRHAPQGEHIEGWAHGLTKIVPVRNPVTLQPLGQYYLYFNRKADALAFIDEVAKLHVLVRRRMGGPAWKSTDPEPLVPYSLAQLAMEGNLGEDGEKRLAAYALLPPSMRLTMSLVDDKASLAKARENEQVIAAAMGIPQTRTHLAHAQSKVSGSQNELSKPAEEKVLAESHKVLLTLRGKRMDPDALLQAIEEDGRERRLAWRLWSEGQSIFPLGAKPSSGHDGEASQLERGRHIQDQISRDDSFMLHNRFIICFPEAVEARRFVRSWHKRSIFLREKDDDDFEVDAVVLWS